jgi:hypothetical protein
MIVKTLVGAAVFGLVPVPTTCGPYTHTRNDDHRSATERIDALPPTCLPEGMTKLWDQLGCIRSRFVTRLSVPS